MEFADGAFLQTAITGAVDGQCWTDFIDFTEARALAVRLSTAALVTIGYLSGMRPEEVLHLERGCSTRQDREDGTVRYRITGRHFKGITDDEGNTLPEGEIRPAPWTVIELVDRAVKVLESLHDDQLLFPRSLTQKARSDDEEEFHGGAIDPPGSRSSSPGPTSRPSASAAITRLFPRPARVRHPAAAATHGRLVHLPPSRRPDRPWTAIRARRHLHGGVVQRPHQGGHFDGVVRVFPGPRR
ncbi:hypothetical protein LRD69_29150 [Streptomyces sp. JH14]|uniref:hypothetical protein n=1 Tax=Streptomyces sp. JH14 TaxID=2793630 RepID=UPI0023FA1037|nr:hypothetical protein [Streptomyces sp. JH14]MDF6046121.1 hypothetical protein [Streptomyces sp. JH14]